MSFSINTNLAALNAHRNLSRIDEQRNSTLERLSTGLRINRAADDASGLSIANGFRPSRWVSARPSKMVRTPPR